MRVIDFHGRLLEEALEDVHMLVGEARMLNTPIDCKFITGHGRIKGHLVEILEDYGIEAREELGNSGVLLALVE